MRTEALAATAREILTRPAPPAGIALGIRTPSGGSTLTAGSRDDQGTELREQDWFDIASVTKVMATTALAMALASRGAIGFDDEISTYVTCPDTGAARVTIRDLLTHRGGLWEWQPFYTRTQDPAGVYGEIARLPLRYPVGAARHYSDLGFMLLGRIIEVATSSSLASAFDALVALPLGLEASFVPAGEGRAFVASARGDEAEERMVTTGEPYPILFEEPFSDWERGVLAGRVNDGNARRCFGGTAGHAGLFATIGGLLDFGSVLAAPEDWEQVFSPQVMGEVLAERRDASQALGFRREIRRFRGEPVDVYWHPGFTGCALGAVPELGIAAAMGSNRLLTRGEPAQTRELWNVLLTHIGLEEEGGER